MKIFKLEENDSKRAYLFLGLLYTILFIPLIFLRYPDLRNEFKYLIIAQDMIESKNYLIMRYFGELYPDKPPIYFWILIFFKKYGGNYTYPLTLLVGGLVPTMLTSMITFRMFSKFLTVQRAFYIAVSLAVLPFAVGISTVLRMDALMNLFIISALYIFYTMYFEKSELSCKKICSIYILIGLGILVKGGAALAVPLVSIIFLLVMERNVAYLKKIKLVQGLGIVIIMVALWLISLYFQPDGKEYVNLLLGQETLGRALKAKTHVRPIYYYASKFPLIFMPFTPFFIWGLWKMLKKIRNFKQWTQVEKISFTWFLAPFVFFSLLSGKLEIYLLPIFAPGIAIALLPIFEEMDNPNGKKTVEKVLKGIISILIGFFLMADIGLPYYEKTYGIKPLVNEIRKIEKSEKSRIIAFRFGDSLNLRDEIGSIIAVPNRDEMKTFIVEEGDIILSRNKYKNELLESGKYIEIFRNKNFSLYKKGE